MAMQHQSPWRWPRCRARGLTIGLTVQTGSAHQRCSGYGDATDLDPSAMADVRETEVAFLRAFMTMSVGPAAPTPLPTSRLRCSDASSFSIAESRRARVPRATSGTRAAPELP